MILNHSPVMIHDPLSLRKKEDPQPIRVITTLDQTTWTKQRKSSQNPRTTLKLRNKDHQVPSILFNF